MTSWLSSAFLAILAVNRCEKSSILFSSVKKEIHLTPLSSETAVLLEESQKFFVHFLRDFLFEHFAF